MSWRPLSHVADDEFESLIHDVSPDLLSYLSRWTQPVDDAADVLAETLLTLWRRHADLPPTRDRARAWAFGIARLQLANHRRGTLRRRALAARLSQQLAGYDPYLTHDDPSMEQIHTALADLPEDDQELITLVNWDGFTINDAAAVMGLPASTARSRYARAKARLTHALESQQRP